MATASIIEQLRYLTECPICNEVMKDPRILPCVHTYCLECLEKLENFHPGSPLLCPVCRYEYTVPADGLKSIRKNFFISKICEAQVTENATADVLPGSCEICKLEFEAGVYCIDCDQIFCEQCSLVHAKFKMAENHRMSDISSKENLLGRFKRKTETCDRHVDRCLDVYCEDCKSFICLKCLTDDHRDHEITDVKTLSQGYRDRLNANLSALAEKQVEFDGHLKKMNVHEERNLSNLDQICVEINRKSDELKRKLDEAVVALSRKVDFLKNQEMNRHKLAREKLELRTTSLSSFAKYAEEITKYGSDRDLIEGFEGLNQRTNVLTDEKWTDKEYKETFYDHSFCKSYTSCQRYLKHFLGDIEEAACGVIEPKKKKVPTATLR